MNRVDRPAPTAALGQKRLFRNAI